MPQNLGSGFIAKILGTLTQTQLVTGKQLDLLTSKYHGDKYTQAYGGALFSGANPSGVTTSAALATTYVGLCLSNPAASGKNLVVRRVAGAFIVAPATITGFNLIVGYSAAGIVTHTTALTPRSNLIGTGAAGVGLLDSACTLVGSGANAPLYAMVLGETPTATTSLSFNVDLEGAFVLPPGAYAAIGTTIAGPASGFQGSIEWEEVAP